MHKGLILIFLSLFVLSCSKVNAPSRSISSIEVNEIEEATNPFAVLQISPNATEFEAEYQVKGLIEKITGYDILALKKEMTENQHFEISSVLSERGEGWLKKVIRSYEVFRVVKKKEGFQFHLGSKVIRLGKKTQELEELDILDKDLELFYEDKNAFYSVKWGEQGLIIGNQPVKVQGYVVKSSPKALKPEYEAEFQRLRARLKGFGGNRSAGEKIKDMLRLNEISTASHQNEIMHTSMNLVQEFKTQEKIDRQFLLAILDGIHSVGDHSCAEILANLH